MSDRLSVFDRLRIERVVWALDQQIYELPRSRRIATRREVRANLSEAALELSTTAALRNLGTSSQLAEEYLQAQFGAGPRASWLSAAVFALTTTLVLTSVLADAGTAFARGVLAVDPHANGVHTWSGITPLPAAGNLHLRPRRLAVGRRCLHPSHLRAAVGRRRARGSAVASAPPTTCR